ncbi:MAG: FkbM family methyltransferase [Geminicoccaceae bacterium]
MTFLGRLARSFGYDLIPRKKAKALHTQLIAILKYHRIETVLDVGANVGQYAERLRDFGYDGKIVSFEPLSSAHAALSERAAGDPAWTIAPRMAIGAEDGDIDIQVSAETDMSSILPQNALLKEISPSSEIQSTERVPLRRLDSVAGDFIGEHDRLILKIDVQGFEAEVLEGASALVPKLIGIQLEMSLVPLYKGALDYRSMVEHMAAHGFELHLVLPGYFERKLARQLEIDGVFVKRLQPNEPE